MDTELVHRTERAVLGMMIEDPGIISEVLERVPPDDWSGAHVHMLETLQGMHEAGDVINPLALVEKLQANGMLMRVGGGAVVLELTQHGYAYGHQGLIEVLENNAIRRKAWQIGVRLQDMAKNAEIDPETVLTKATEGLESITRSHGTVTTLGWPEGHELIQPSFVIPNLLAEDDRVMFTGGEGGGKTVLLRQFVASVVVGRHPFLFSQFEPAPALHIDLENPQYLSDNAYRQIRNSLMADGVEVPDLLHRLQPRTWNVFNDRDVAWLMRTIRAVQPRLVAIGPLKNMVGDGDLNEERVAVKVCDTLNRIRAETGAALVVEAHASWDSRKDNWRPRGSSAIVGWPEFGFGMKPLSVKNPRAAQLIPWRGARVEDRYWPEYLAQGTVWPWVEDPRLER